MLFLLNRNEIYIFDFFFNQNSEHFSKQPASVLPSHHGKQRRAEVAFGLKCGRLGNVYHPQAYIETTIIQICLTRKWGF